MRIRRSFALASIAILAATVGTVTATIPASAGGPPPACVASTDFTESENGGYTTVTFSAVGRACQFSIPNGVSSIDYLAVGGGGGGGGGGMYYTPENCTYNSGLSGTNDKPGGGGAGGGGGDVISGTRSVSDGDILQVGIGVGGLAGKPAGCGADGLSSQNNSAYTSEGQGGDGGSGSNTSLYLNGNLLTLALGGAGGGGGSNTGDGGAAAGNSMNFVGGTNPNTSVDCTNAATAPCYSAPGGAGAGANGSDPATFSASGCSPSGSLTDANGGAGGAGVSWSVNGISYGGGGGGGNRHPSTNPGRCSSGTRAGGSATDGGGAGNATGNGTAGTDGLGGGGGGGRGNGASIAGMSNAGTGGQGGNGNVIIRYATPVSGYTITFNSNGGSGTMDAQNASSTTNLTANTFTNGSCQFAGWNTDALGKGTSYADNAPYAFDASDELFAQWKCGAAMITAGTTTCAMFASDSTSAISSLTATIAKQGTKSTISGVNIGAVYYWAKVTIPASGTSGTLFTQNTTAPGLRLTAIGSNYVFDTSCVLQKGPNVSVANDGLTATLSGVTGGSTYYIAVKMSSTALKGKTAPTTWPVDWTFVSGFDAIDTTVSLIKK